MRCDDVTRELAAPTGAPGAPALTEHLAGCARCASWAAQSGRLDRIWEATRPAELSDAAWDRIWSNVSETLDRPRPASPLRLTGSGARPWHRSAVAVFVLAEAAAILLGFATLLQTTTGQRTSPRPEAPVLAEVPVVQTEEGQIVLIHLDDHSVRDVAQNENPYAIDPFSLPMFNDFESLASLQ